MYVMFDMVINHVGYGDYSSFNPYNSPEDFHDCEGETLHLSWACRRSATNVDILSGCRHAALAYKPKL
jgi:hypothetical protein